MYGVRNVRALLRLQWWDIGRGRTARLTRVAGVRGVKRSRRVYAARSDCGALKTVDLVRRRFHASAPLQLWAADITYVRTWQGFVPGVRDRGVLAADRTLERRCDILPLGAPDMAAHSAGGDLTGLVPHADHGSNYLSLVYTERIADLGATPSTGTIGTPSIAPWPRRSTACAKPN